MVRKVTHTKASPSKKGRTYNLEFTELTLWKIGTIVFAVLFLYMLFTCDGSSKTMEPTQVVPSPTAPAAPGVVPPPTPVDVEIGDAYARGKKNAPVEIIEFSDFECPFCGRFYSDAYKKILENYVDTGKVRFAFKHLPLSFHPNAQKASEATECAGKVGGDDSFWAMHDMIFENQGAITIPDLKRYAGDLGLDQGDFDSCLDNGDTAEKVKAHAAEAASLGASGTPTFFVNGVKVVGAQPYQAFEAVIEAAL